MAAGLEKTLPRRYYLAEDVYGLEKERIFAHEWFCGGREEQIPHAGDYLVLDVAGESVLVVRTTEGTLKAFHNVCRHRGTRLRDAEAFAASDAAPCGPHGRFPGSIQCPYHAWTYALDGSLLSAPYLSTTGLVEKGDFPLFEVRLDTWCGFFFLNLSAEAGPAPRQDLASHLGAISTRIARYPLGNLRIARRIVYDVQANWKVIVENYNECYHCGPVHPELCEIVPAFRAQGVASFPLSMDQRTMKKTMKKTA